MEPKKNETRQSSLGEEVHTLTEQEKKILDTNPITTVDLSKSKRGEKYFREYGVYKFINIEFPNKEITFKIGNAGRCVTLNLKAGNKYHLPRYVAMHVNSKKIPVYKNETVNCEQYSGAPIIDYITRFSLTEVVDE